MGLLSCCFPPLLHRPAGARVSVPLATVVASVYVRGDGAMPNTCCYAVVWIWDKNLLGRRTGTPESIVHKAVSPGSFSYLDLLPFQKKFVKSSILAMSSIACVRQVTI